MRDPPPPGINFRSADELPADVLCAALAATASFLQHPDPTLRLRRFHDWLQHDGLMFDRGEVDFHELFRMIGTPRALLAAMPGDHEVRVGVAPAEGTPWYLRFILDWDADDTHLVGAFDVTLPPELAERYRREVVPGLGFAVDEEDAAVYFARITESD